LLACKPQPRLSKWQRAMWLFSFSTFLDPSPSLTSHPLRLPTVAGTGSIPSGSGRGVCSKVVNSSVLSNDGPALRFDSTSYVRMSISSRFSSLWVPQSEASLSGGGHSRGRSNYVRRGSSIIVCASYRATEYIEEDYPPVSCVYNKQESLWRPSRDTMPTSWLKSSTKRPACGPTLPFLSGLIPDLGRRHLTPISQSTTEGPRPSSPRPSSYDKRIGKPLGRGWGRH